MVNLLDSGTSVPGLSPGREHCVVFLGKLLYPDSVCLSPRCTNRYVPANLMLGVALRWSSIQFREGGSRYTASSVMVLKPG